MTPTNPDQPRGHANNKGSWTSKQQGAPDTSLPERKPGQLGGYELKGFKTLNTGMEGGAFTASIYKDGRRAILVSYDGNGGNYTYTDAATGRRHMGEAIDEFIEFAKKATEQSFEPEDHLIGVLAYLRDVEKMAVKGGLNRDEVMEYNLGLDQDFTDRDRAILLNPDIVNT